MRLRRLPRDDDGHSRYLHPHGYVIVQNHRDWDHDRVPGGYVGSNDPKWWWEAREHISSSREHRFQPWVVREHGDYVTFRTLRDARAWCDAKPRGGWLSEEASRG